MDEKRTCKVCGRELPVVDFSKNMRGYTHVCRECANAKKRDTWAKKSKDRDLEKELSEAKTLRLQDFTPRELMTELARRGYRGKLKYVHIEEIDLSNF